VQAPAPESLVLHKYIKISDITKLLCDRSACYSKKRQSFHRLNPNHHGKESDDVLVAMCGTPCSLLAVFLVFLNKNVSSLAV
jgi:hypothetical protein